MKRKLVFSVLIALIAAGPVSALTMGPPEKLELPADVNCLLAPQKGPCKAMFEKYYYDGKEQKCKPFFWGGCDGVVPFETSEECEKVCLAPLGLKIREIRSVDDVYASVSVEFPKAWDVIEFRVAVEDREVNVKKQSGGFTEDRQMASLLFFPGEAGVKRITVSGLVEGRTVTATALLNWAGRPFVALLGYAGDRTLVTGPEKVRIVAANVYEVVILVNKQVADPEVVGREAKIFSFTPAWQSGTNIVTLDGKDKSGHPTTKTYTFFYTPSGIRQGETALLRYGVEGTRSGPFYSTAVEGDSVSIGSARSVDSYTLSDDGWIGRQTLLVKELKAIKPGKAKVRIFEKPHFLQEKALKEEISLTVVPVPAGK